MGVLIIIRISKLGSHLKRDVWAEAGRGRLRSAGGGSGASAQSSRRRLRRRREPSARMYGDAHLAETQRQREPDRLLVGVSARAAGGQRARSRSWASSSGRPMVSRPRFLPNMLHVVRHHLTTASRLPRLRLRAGLRRKFLTCAQGLHEPAALRLVLARRGRRTSPSPRLPVWWAVHGERSGRARARSRRSVARG